jgi:uncharacterized protein (TIGR00255 family)
MLKSMTGFAQVSAANEAYEVAAEIRAVNHRYLEVRLRASGNTASASLEKRVRDRVSRSLGRGKVDVTLHVAALSGSSHQIRVDRPLLQEFVSLAKSLGKELGVAGELTLSDLLAFSPGFSIEEKKLLEDSALEATIDRAMDLAVESLERMRETEGAAMASDLEARVALLEEAVSVVEKLSLESRETKRRELEAKVQELLGASLEPASIAAEVARLAERADVSEEVTRFRSHIALWKNAVQGPEPCGKKLDFILQEMNREVNTIGSKCQEAAITERVIEMKTELERVREQVQNVE